MNEQNNIVINNVLYQIADKKYNSKSSHFARVRIPRKMKLPCRNGMKKAENTILIAVKLKYEINILYNLKRSCNLHCRLHKTEFFDNVSIKFSFC